MFSYTIIPKQSRTLIKYVNKLMKLTPSRDIAEKADSSKWIDRLQKGSGIKRRVG